MVIHYLAALNKSLKTKETKIQKQIVKVLQQASDRRKKRKVQDQNHEILGIDLVFIG